jgi:hypothetical protein
MSNFENPKNDIPAVSDKSKINPDLNLNNLVVMEFLEKNHPEILENLAKIELAKNEEIKKAKKEIAKSYTRNLLNDFLTPKIA